MFYFFNFQDVGSFTKLPRFLSTNANTQADSELKGTASDSHSDQGKQSGDSHQSSEQGKSVRGGVIFLLHLDFLCQFRY